MNICGLKIDSKTDVLALLAFLGSLATGTYQVYGYFVGPDVKMFVPDQVLISSREMGKVKFVNFAAKVSYVNVGQQGNNAAITNERIVFKIGDKTYEHKWQEFIKSSNKGTELQVEREADALPFSVNAGSTVSHVTRFAPRSKAGKNGYGKDANINYLKWDDFLAALKATKQIDVELTADVYGKRRPLSCKGKVYVTEPFVAFLAKNGWNAPPVETE